jgi:mono/diheme cytochrome c family protein
MTMTKRNTKLKTIFLMLCLGASTIAAAQKDNAKKNNDIVKNSVYAELGKVPAKDAAKHNPLEKDPNAIAAGEKIFGLHCAECHGASADGGHKGPSLRAEQVQQATPGALFWVLTNGEVRHGMPVWSKLPEPQRWQIVSYVKSLTPTTKQQATIALPPIAASRQISR